VTLPLAILRYSNQEVCNAPLPFAGAWHVLKGQEVHQDFGEAAHHAEVPRSTPQVMHLAQGALEVHSRAYGMPVFSALMVL
jgi:hypothetical protein